MRTKHTLILTIALMLSFAASAQWVQQNTPAMKGLFHMTAAGKNAMWTVNANLGGLDTAFVQQYIRTGDGGKTYKLTTLPKTDFSAIFPEDGRKAYLLGGSLAGEYFFRRTVDSGATWQNMPFTPPTFPGFIHFYDANNGIYLGDPDSLGYYAAYTSDGGNTFTRIPQSNLPRARENEFTNLGLHQIIGDNIFMQTYIFNPTTNDLKWGLLRSVDRGRNWTASAEIIPNDPFEPRFAFSDGNNGVVMRGIGTIDNKSPFYTTDGGATWQESGKYPGLASYPIALIPNTQTMVAMFQDTVRGVTFTAATNDLGKTWNSRKDIGASILDRRYAAIYGLDSYINGQLEIVDNNTAWAQFSNTAIHRYDNATPLVPEKPDLDLTLTADTEGLPLWGYVKFTLTMRNRGISKATDVKANWLPPYKRTDNGGEAFANVGAYASKGNYNWWTGDWTLSELAAGESATATFHLFVVNNTANVAQTAQITACNELDLDSSPNNMAASPKEDDEVTFVSKATVRAAPDAPTVVKSSIGVYPNPTTDKINVIYKMREISDLTLSLTDANGRIVLEKTTPSVKTGAETLSLLDLAKGVYFLKLTNAAGEVLVQKVVKQ
jgi:photosystem II stability/assembly factor-like uncharacterized protein